VLRRTSRDYAPWHVIEGFDPQLPQPGGGAHPAGKPAKRAGQQPQGQAPGQRGPLGSIDQKSLLGALDMTLRLDKRDYEEQLITEQARLAGLLRDKRMRRHALVAVFEGNDAAGKGGAIRRVAAALDPRQYRIVPIAAPTEEERAQPTCGGSGGTFRRAASSPSSTAPGMAGCWWSGSKALQPGRLDACLWRDQRLRGATARCRRGGGQVLAGHRPADPTGALPGTRAIPFKRFKITEEDWRNRDKWDDYRKRWATWSTAPAPRSPWTLVEANDKRWARVKVLRTINQALEAAFAKHKNSRGAWAFELGARSPRSDTNTGGARCREAAQHLQPCPKMT
jgi:polyphosphate kinase 2 (PPK2 family)